MDARTTDAVARRLEAFVFRKFLVSVVGGDSGQITCEGGELAIGTAQGNDLVLTDPTVSRHHCAISVTPRGYELRDLGSTNGTWLANHLVEVAYLKRGSTFRVGGVTIRFDWLDEEVREELSTADQFGDALGESPVMRRIFAILAKVAPSESTILLEGETGTGKGLLAELVHRNSLRANRPLGVVDCAAIPPSLIESELFGHEKGSFTGADATRVGAFEAAQGGTLFLDEIGEVPLELQAKLLRALEERTIKRVGSTKPIRLDLRVIAATNRDLRTEVNQARFRADLYYRLNVVRVHIPPLRERREDIALLVHHYYRIFTGDDHATAPASLVAPLTQQRWPGNVRELRSAVERAVLMTGSQHEWPSEPGSEEHLSFREAKERAVAAWESVYLSDLIARHGGNVSRAARAVHMDRTHLRELLRRYGRTD